MLKEKRIADEAAEKESESDEEEEVSVLVSSENTDDEAEATGVVVVAALLTAIIQFQNLKLSQKVEAHRVAFSLLADKLSLINEKQKPIRCSNFLLLSHLTAAVESCSVRVSDSSNGAQGFVNKEGINNLPRLFSAMLIHHPKYLNQKYINMDVDLDSLLQKPVLGLSKFKHLMENSLNESLPKAQYARGILEYFYYNNKHLGLQHLQKASDASLQEAIYLYGIIKLCVGHVEEGKTYLDKLNWLEDRSTADSCWKTIKRSLHGIGVTREMIYHASLNTMFPPDTCDRFKEDKACPKCYYYKQMYKFIFLS
ncbi:unnamed protein product [Cochlearia groenlandica]